jgi:hypothetical protein
MIPSMKQQHQAAAAAAAAADPKIGKPKRVT